MKKNEMMTSYGTITRVYDMMLADGTTVNVYDWAECKLECLGMLDKGMFEVSNFGRGNFVQECREQYYEIVREDMEGFDIFLEELSEFNLVSDFLDKCKALENKVQRSKETAKHYVRRMGKRIFDFDGRRMAVRRGKAE